MKKYLVLLLVTGSVLLLDSCYYSNEEDIYGQGSNCDLTTAKYSQKVKSVLSANCESCHGAGLQSGGIRLDSYAAVKSLAESGVLLKVIRHESGVVPMPYGLAKMSDCNISVIEEWVKNGALDDWGGDLQFTITVDNYNE